MYSDILGNETNSIITLASEMLNENNEMIGIISADIMVDEILEGIQRLRYLGKGYSAMVTRDGNILKTDQHNYFWKEFTSLDDIEDKTFVSKIQNMKDSNETMFYLLEDSVLYRVAAQMIGPVIIDAASTDDYWYTVLLIVEESEIMKYKHESEDKIQEAGIYLILITLSASLVTIVVIVILIHYLAKSITEPLQGIIDFTNKINANATEKDMVTIEELEKLKDGEDQVAHLVQAFKSLASGLINRREDRMPRALQTTQTKVYPPNELYKSNKITWRELIERIPQ
jgi:methyl-accepting chemotaxis protein